MPAALEIVSDTLDRLVELALNGTGFRRQLGWN